MIPKLILPILRYINVKLIFRSKDIFSIWKNNNKKQIIMNFICIHYIFFIIWMNSYKEMNDLKKAWTIEMDKIKVQTFLHFLTEISPKPQRMQINFLRICSPFYSASFDEPIIHFLIFDLTLLRFQSFYSGIILLSILHLLMYKS